MQIRFVDLDAACQALGACIRSVRAGAMGAASAFSFCPAKISTGRATAGLPRSIALNCGDHRQVELVARILSLRDHGRISHYLHQEIGCDARLEAIQAAVLRAKLEKLDQRNAKRCELAEAYYERLARRA